MIKKWTINKIVVASVSLFLLFMFYLIPTKPNIETEVIEKEEVLKENVVYLLDEDNYVSRVVTYYDKTDIKDIIRNKIDTLTNSDKKNFYPLIPKGTKLNDVKVEKDAVYLDFSSEILSVNKYIEEEMIEAIVYSVTEINGINSVYIAVDSKELKKLPNSLKELSYPLTRKYGINKKYNIDSFENIDTTTVYFSKSSDDDIYYVPVTYVTNTSSEKIDIIIEELKSSINSQDNLNSFVSNMVEVVDYNIDNDKFNLVFNEYIFGDLEKNVILEEVKYVISASIFENYDVKEVIFNTKDQKNVAEIVKK